MDTTPCLSALPPTITGLPRQPGWSSCSTEAKNASRSTSRIAGPSQGATITVRLYRDIGHQREGGRFGRIERTPSHHRMGRLRSRINGTRHVARFRDLHHRLARLLADAQSARHARGLQPCAEPADAKSHHAGRRTHGASPNSRAAGKTLRRTPRLRSRRRIGDRRASCRGELVRATIRGGARTLSRRL